MDPVAGTSAAIILGLAGKPAVGVVANLVGRLLNPSADAGGDALKEWFSRRSDRGIAVVEGAGKMLRTAELDPQPVPGRILFPILQHASVEEDDDLRAKWTALLANAASPGPENQILPAFAEILRQLVPIQAKILDHIYQQTYELDEGEKRWSPVERDSVMNQFGLSRANYTLLVSDLERLQLIDVRQGEMSVPEMNESLYGTIRPTALSIAFMRACTPPGDFSGPAST